MPLRVTKTPRITARRPVRDYNFDQVVSEVGVYRPPSQKHPLYDGALRKVPNGNEGNKFLLFWQETST